MSFFILGSPKVEERDNRVHVSNIHTRTMMNDIKRIFRTSRVNTYLFTDVSRGGFVFESFFALEMYHLASQLRNDRRIGTDVRTLDKLCQALLTHTWLRNIHEPVEGRLNFARLKDLNYPPLDYQQKFLEAYSERTEQYGLNGMLLNAAAGSGKTYTALALGQCLEVERVVVFCPKSAIDRVWVKNTKSVFKKETSYWAHAHGAPYNGETVAIYHYEAMDKALKDIRQHQNKKTLVVLDESHNLNEMTALRTQRFIEFCSSIEETDVILASGTPIKATTLETVPLFKTIDPQFTDEVMGRFKKIFAGDTNRATRILAERIGIVSFKVEKDELNLEPPIFRNVPVSIPNSDEYTLDAIKVKMRNYASDRMAYYLENKQKYEAIYDEGVKEAYEAMMSGAPNTREAIKIDDGMRHYRGQIALIQQAHERGDLQSVSDEIQETNRYERTVIIPNIEDPLLRKEFKEAKTVVKYLKLKIQGECLGRVLGRERINAHVDMVKHVNYAEIMATTTKKTVAFTSYVEVLEAVDQHLTDEGAHPVSVYGKNTSELAKTVQRFEEDKLLNPLLATYQSLSTAVPLVMADTMILMNAPYRDYVLQQAVSRIHRLDSDTQTYVYTLILDTGDQPNISSRNLDILKWSQSQIENILQMESPFKVEYEGEGDFSEPSMEELEMLPLKEPLDIPVAEKDHWLNWSLK